MCKHFATDYEKESKRYTEKVKRERRKVREGVTQGNGRQEEKERARLRGMGR